MSAKPPCLINQDACGREAGNPVCPKCGLDERVVYPGGQGDLEVALTNARAKYLETHAQQLEDEAKALAKAKAEAESKAREQEQAQASALQQAESQAAKQAELIQIMLAAEAAAQANRTQEAEREKQKAQTKLMVTMIFCLAVGAGGGWWWSKRQTTHQDQAPPVAVPTQPSEVATAPHQPWEPQMVAIPAGGFTMGSKDYGDEKPPHRVNIRRFELGKYEVTQGQWKAVMGNNPSNFSNCGDNCPVERVSWDDIQQFIQKLNQKTGKTYRLPSESEWEYAARAGTTTRYWWGDSASHEYANYGKDDCCDGLAQGRDRWENTAPVGQFPANAFGLHDMNGNVSEWVQDVWHDNYNGAPSDGSAWESGGDSRRVLRGGSWSYDPRSLRSVGRYGSSPDIWGEVVGFRLARTVP